MQFEYIARHSSLISTALVVTYEGLAYTHTHTHSKRMDKYLFVCLYACKSLSGKCGRQFTANPIAFTYVCRVVNVYLYAHPKACIEACHSCVCVCVCVQTLFTAYFDDKYVAHTLTTNELLQTRS